MEDETEKACGRMKHLLTSIRCMEGWAEKVARFPTEEVIRGGNF